MSFKVFVEDNFHYQDESERYQRGEYDSFEAAVAECKRIVDDYLAAAFAEGMSAAELLRSYVSFGEDPFVVPAAPDSRFSARDYARQRCTEICGADQGAAGGAAPAGSPGSPGAGSGQHARSH